MSYLGSVLLPLPPVSVASKHMDDARIMTSIGVLLGVEIEAPVEAAGPSASGPLHEVVDVASASPPLMPPHRGPIINEILDLDDVKPVSKGGPTITEIPDDAPVPGTSGAAKSKKNRRNRSKKKAPTSGAATAVPASETPPNLAPTPPEKIAKEAASLEPADVLEGVSVDPGCSGRKVERTELVRPRVECPPA